MNKDLHKIFNLAAKYFFKKYRDNGGTQAKLAKKLGVAQSYISSILTGNKHASLDLQSQIASILYQGPYEDFLTIGRRIQNGLDPEFYTQKATDDSVESLITRLTHYVVDHQRIETQLVNMRNFYEKIVENLQSGVIVSDAYDDITYVNRYIEHLIGVPAESLIGTNQIINSEKYPDRKLGSLRDFYIKAKEILEPVSYENIFVTTSGSRDLWVTGWMIPLIKENRYDGMICTILNMTRLQKMNQAFFATLEYTDCPMAIALQEKEGGPVTSFYMNKVGLEIMGISQVDLDKKNFKKNMLQSASLMKNGEEWLEFTRKNFLGRDNVEMIVQMKDGRKFTWESNSLHDQEGNYYGRIVHLKEILRDKHKKVRKKNI